MRRAGINPRDAPEIQKQLLFAEVLFSEIREAGKEKKNSKQSIRSVTSGKILRKFKLIYYTARRTNTDWRKLLKGLSKVINPNKSKRGFEPNLYKAVINFYNLDDVSTALPGKRDAKKVKQGKPHIQKRVLNDYLSNLHQKLVSEHTNMSCSFTPLTRMRSKNSVLANFANRWTCLCTQHYPLKLKKLRKYAGIPTNLEAFVKYSDQKISSIIDNMKHQDFTYDIRKKVEVMYKGQTCGKMKMIIQRPFEWSMTDGLGNHLPPNHVYIHMDFAEDYRCRSQIEIRLPIGHQLRSLSILLWCTIKHRIQKKAVTKALSLFQMSQVMM